MDSDAAFNTLRKLSQDTDTPVRTIAERLVQVQTEEFGHNDIP
ncbi:ANTAR domain-containing protein [Mycolicibacterium chubuense]|nr:ANTAR domain-containing protein [Mycolicibacterium chubuense]